MIYHDLNAVELKSIIYIENVLTHLNRKSKKHYYKTFNMFVNCCCLSHWINNQVQMELNSLRNQIKSFHWLSY